MKVLNPRNVNDQEYFIRREDAKFVYCDGDGCSEIMLKIEAYKYMDNGRTLFFCEKCFTVKIHS